jgi:DNA polymerase-1
MAINAPMQGTAADIIKIAMIRMDAWILENMIDAHMVMQVHDELIFEVPEEKVDIFIPKLQEIMTDAVKLHVPLVVGIGIGNNWDEAH